MGGEGGADRLLERVRIGHPAEPIRGEIDTAGERGFSTRLRERVIAVYQDRG